ncbi:MAG: NAD(P)/FAD-dependent oxidoreductase [Microthrixaceae bacterium]
MTRVLVVGGGIIGTAHAHEAVERGFDVVHFEANPETREASVRSLGTLSFSAASPGLDLELSMKADLAWQRMLGPSTNTTTGQPVLRRTGSLTVATDAEEWATLEKLAASADADLRSWSLLGREESEKTSAALQGQFTGSLRSSLDAVLDPAAALSSLRRQMEESGRYRFSAGTEIRDVESDGVVDYAGRVTKGDFVVLCPGSSFRLASSVLRQPSTLRPVRIQAVETGPPIRRIPIPMWDVTSLLAHGADGGHAYRAVSPEEDGTQLRVKCIPRPNGNLLVGEVQEDEDPQRFDLRERPMTEVIRRLELILGQELPAISRRWSGTVYESTDGRLWHRDDLDQSVVLVGGTDERGVTLAPSIAADTFDWLVDGIDSGATRPGAKHS